MNHWLLKSEPGTFSIDDLAANGRATPPAWDGVRNYQARNMLARLDEERVTPPFFIIRAARSRVSRASFAS